MFQSSLGIDITDERVVFVNLKTSLQGIRMAAHEIHPLDPDVALTEKLETVGGLALDFMQRQGIANANVYLGVPRQMVLLRKLTYPAAVKENLHETIRYELEKYIPLPAETVYLDYQILSLHRQDNQLEILLAVAKKENLSALIELGDRLGIGISGIEFTSTALTNFVCAGLTAAAPHRLAVVYAESNHLEVCCIENRGLISSRLISLASDPDQIYDKIAKELRQTGIYPNHPQDELPLWYQGPESIHELLTPFREDPQFDVQAIDLADVRVPKAELMPAYGLALKGLKPMPMRLNLLPVQLRKRPSKASLYLMFALAGLLILSALVWGGGHVLKQRLILKHLDQRIGQLADEVKNIDRLEATTARLREQIGFFVQLRQTNQLSLMVLKELSDLIPKTAWVRNLTLTDTELQIDGHADSAYELISLLESSPLFRDVVFRSTITKGRDNKERFKIGMKIELP